MLFPLIVFFFEACAPSSTQASTTIPQKEYDDGERSAIRRPEGAKPPQQYISEKGNGSVQLHYGHKSTWKMLKRRSTFFHQYEISLATICVMVLVIPSITWSFCDMNEYSDGTSEDSMREMISNSPVVHATLVTLESFETAFARVSST